MTAPASVATEDVLLFLRSLPGLAVKGSAQRGWGLKVTGYENTWGMAQRLSGALGAQLHWTVAPPPEVPWESVLGALKSRGEVDIQWVKKAYPWQRFGLSRAALRPSFHFWWPTGAGKTLGAIWWMLLASGPAAVVCPARVRIQWGKAIRKFTSIVPYVFDPQAKGKKARQRPHPLEYGEWEQEGPFWVRKWAVVEGHKEPAQPYAAVVREGPSGCSWITRGVGARLDWKNPPSKGWKDAGGVLAAKSAADDKIEKYRNQTLRTRERAQTSEEVYRAKPKPTLERYLEYCEDQKQRPVVVAALESLPNYIEQILSISPTSVAYDEIHRLKGWTRESWVPLAKTTDPLKLQEQIADARKRGAEIVEFKDGSRSLKIPKQGRVNAALQLSQQASRRLGCTATPVFDRTRDLWGQLDICLPTPNVRYAVGAWGSFRKFTARYCEGKPGFYGGWDSRGYSNGEELEERLACEAHRVDYETTTAHLPGKRRISYYVPPDEQQAPGQEFRKIMQDAARRGASALLWARLAEMASRKRGVVLGVAEDILSDVKSNRKVTIFTGTHQDCEAIAKAAGKKLGKFADIRWAHGGIDPSRRQETTDWYKEHKGGCLLVATWDAMGEGIDGLQCTDAFLCAMLPWNPGKLRQGEGRFAGRGGQDRPVDIYYFVGQAEGAQISIDEHMASTLIDKLEAVEEVAQDTELGEARAALSGVEDMTEEEFAQSILSKIGGDAVVDSEDGEEWF